ncbi:MAG TPA: hypothetical protein DCS38_02680 [Ruminococcus sp.]|nr:hypothetical protein [Ruminococcus sp.]
MKRYIILSLIVISLLMIISVYGYETDIPAEETAESTDISSEMRSENDVLENMECVLENENLKLYLKKDEDLFALVNKKNNYIWWSSPVNAGCDENATDALKSELKSSLVISYYSENSSSVSSLKSAKDADISYSSDGNSLTAEYDFRKYGINVKAEYSLGEDFIQADILSENISENKNCLVCGISIMNAFGAADSSENGYFIIPDGSGAVINFNNGKINAKQYSSMVYGDDMTASSEKKAANSEKISLPLYSIVKNDNAVLAVIRKGDANATLNSAVSIQSSTSYNKAYFTFTVHEKDSYYIGSEENPITVCNNKKNNNDISLRYYILDDNDISYCNIAEKYREYLLSELNVSAKDCLKSPDIYIDLYGGALKKQSVLGIPVYQKQCFTSFSQAQKLISDIDAENKAVSFRNWTDDGIEHKTDFSGSPSETLSGKTDFQKLCEYTENKLYPVSENISFSSGNGYSRLSDSAIRVSGSYSEISAYDYAYGVKDKFRKKYSLLSPSALSRIYDEISENYPSENISLGKSLSVLYGDYGKNYTSREDMKNIIINCLEKLDMNILAENPNAYALPYIDCITDIPVNSSRYDIFDYDIPFYQMVLHGIVPYSCEPVNSSANTCDMLIKAAAYGSALNYDLVYSDVSELKNTEADIYFYSNYSNINQDYQLAKDIIKAVKDCTITAYKPLEKGFEISYSNNVKIIYDGKNYKMTDSNIKH